jgi:hypothetical protein
VSRNRFVVPGTTRLALSDGDWIEIKTQLTYAESERLKVAGLSRKQRTAGLSSGDNQELEFDLGAYNPARIEIWLVEWSFRGADDKPVAITKNAIAALDPDTAAEIHAALDAYLEAQEAEKKAKTTPPASGEPSG